MSKIIDIIKKLENLYHLEPASEIDIRKAEKILGITFADDFRAYTRNYGAISANGLELTGVTTTKRLDVVTVTLAEREMRNIPPTMYVVENLAIDGIIILQDYTGTIYQSVLGRSPQKISSSLSDYIMSRQ